MQPWRQLLERTATTLTMAKPVPMNDYDLRILEEIELRLGEINQAMGQPDDSKLY